jgi:hypothetical protein
MRKEVPDEKKKKKKKKVKKVTFTQVSQDYKIKPF